MIYSFFSQGANIQIVQQQTLDRCPEDITAPTASSKESASHHVSPSKSFILCYSSN